jgi:hypothetical protein
LTRIPKVNVMTSDVTLMQTMLPGPHPAAAGKKCAP